MSGSARMRARFTGRGSRGVWRCCSVWPPWSRLSRGGCCVGSRGCPSWRLSSSGRRGTRRSRPSSDGWPSRRRVRVAAVRGVSLVGSQVAEAHHLAQVAEPTMVVSHEPERCEGCGGGLVTADCLGVERRQVFDLPPETRLCQHSARRRIHDREPEMPDAARRPPRENTRRTRPTDRPTTARTHHRRPLQPATDARRNLVAYDGR